MEIRKCREASNLSKKDVAIAVNVDLSTVTKWETNASAPRAGVLPMLADLFHCSIDALFGRTGEHPSA